MGAEIVQSKLQNEMENILFATRVFTFGSFIFVFSSVRNGPQVSFIGKNLILRSSILKSSPQLRASAHFLQNFLLYSVAVSVLLESLLFFEKTDRFRFSTSTPIAVGPQIPLLLIFMQIRKT
jgi:hypothetical protein